MLYLKAINDQVEKYPYSLGQLRKDNSNTSFPKQPSLLELSEFDVYPVTEVTPILTDSEKLVKVWVPTLISGHWILPHKAVQKTEEDLEIELNVKFSNLREQRNKLLVETDFYGLTDVTVTDEMTSYRQTLRDLPSHVLNGINAEPPTIDINNIIYPEKP
jgi:hypothetical protein